MRPWDKQVFVIAEAGVNHNGQADFAFQLIDAAADSGADAVKFQSFFTEKVISRDAPMASYQKENIGGSGTQYDMVKPLELSPVLQADLKAYAAKRGILWFSTAFDFDSIDLLQGFDIPVWKIPSGEITNYPYLKRIGSIGKPVIMSTGMCSLGDVEAAVDVVLQAGLSRDDLCILHCTTEYPTPWTDVNLRAMPMIGQAFGTTFGYSDHTMGIEVPIAAVALGARVIEKHFTLDRSLPGPDHKASLEPKELAAMVSSIRHLEMALGTGLKHLMPSEAGNRKVARKSIVAARAIHAGEVFTESALTVLRPGEGISPMEWPKLLGRKATRDYAPGEPIQW